MAGENAPAIMQGMTDGDKVDLLLEGVYFTTYDREEGEIATPNNKWLSE